MNHPTVRRGMMPDYATITWEGVQFTAHPVGWRGIPGLTWILRKVPLFSGSRQVFCVHVKAVEANRRNDSIKIDWIYHGPSSPQSSRIHTVSKSLMKTAKFHAFTPRIMESGEGGIRIIDASLSNGVVMEHSRHSESLDLVGFDVKSSDSLMLIVYGLFASLLISVLGAWFGAWAGTTFYRSDTPIRIVIESPVRPLSEPTGESQLPALEPDKR